MTRTEAILQGRTSITINSSLTKHGHFTEQRAIYVTTDVPIAITVTNFNDGSLDSYLALPVPVLGLRYRTASYSPADAQTSNNAVIMIAAVHDNTEVQVMTTDKSRASINMNRFFVHQISSIYDLSNIEIIATKPVAVISGTICAFVPHNARDCDMLLEQMLPVESWSAGTFIVRPFERSRGFLLKILTDGNSSFCLRNSTKTICNSSRHLPEEEFFMGTEPVVVTSSGLTLRSAIL